MLACTRAATATSAKSQPPFPPPSRTRRARVLESRARNRSCMRGPLVPVMENVNDWDLQAVVRSCSFAHAEEPAGARHASSAAREAEAAGPRQQQPPAPQQERAPARAAPAATAKHTTRMYGLEYLGLDRKPFLLPPSTTAAAPSRAADDAGREVMISFPAASGVQSRAVPPGRKAGARTPPRPKRSKKSQLKKVVREMPVADGGVSSSDPWAWRKYGQKPIKGSPYPRGYYKCSSMKGCMARKLVERSPAKPGVLVVTYMGEHCHPVPTQLNALAGTTRHSKPASAAAAEDHPASSPDKSHEQQGPAADSNEAPAAVQCAAAASADCESGFWPAGMDLDELLAPVDDDFDFEYVLDDDDGVLGRQLSL